MVTNPLARGALNLLRRFADGGKTVDRLARCLDAAASTRRAQCAEY
jgi:hypothetical protein